MMRWLQILFLISCVTHAIDIECEDLNCENTQCLFNRNLNVKCTGSKSNRCIISTAGDFILKAGVIVQTKGNCELVFSIGNAVVVETNAVINAPSINITSSKFAMAMGAVLNATAKGLEGGLGAGSFYRGASHGGSGGRRQSNESTFSNCPPQNCIGQSDLAKTWARENMQQLLYGSGGGINSSVFGGGRIRISSVISISLSKGSRIEANGMNAYNSGAGAGGSIFLESLAISSAGNIQAKGGDSSCSSPEMCFPAGGGGRIMFSFSSSNFDSQNVQVSGGNSFNPNPSLLGASGTDFRLSKGFGKSLMTATLIVENTGHTRRSQAITPVYVAANVSLANTLIFRNYAMCGGPELSLSTIDGSPSEIILMNHAIYTGLPDTALLTVRSESLRISGSSALIASSGSTIMTKSFSLGASSQLKFEGAAKIVAKNDIVLAGQVIGSGDMSSLIVLGRSIALAGNASAGVVLMYGKDWVALTGNVVSTRRDCLEKEWTGCDNFHHSVDVLTNDLAPQTVTQLVEYSNYSCTLASNGSVYIGQSDSAEVEVSASSLLVCAPSTIGISSHGNLNVSANGCVAEQGLGAGACITVNASVVGTGAGFGGAGGTVRNANDGGLIYGDAKGLAMPGSGGGCSGGGNGGGLVVLETNVLLMNGTIDADGAAGGAGGGGGGSGGYVYIHVAESLSGRGVISSNGGTGYQGDSSTLTSFGCGGGGGRLKFLICDQQFDEKCSVNFTGSFSAIGGASYKGFQGDNGTQFGNSCPPGYTGILCHACPIGTYKNDSGSYDCQACENAPPYAHYTTSAEQSPMCEWACNPGYSGRTCRTPFQILLHGFGGTAGFVVVLLGIVGFFTLVGVFCRQRKLNHRVRFRSTTSKHERQKLLEASSKRSSIWWAPFRCCSLPRLGYPKLREKELGDHIYRIYFSGENTPLSPWRLDPIPPRALANIVYAAEFATLAQRINSAVTWPEARLTDLLYLVSCLFVYPFASDLIQYRRYRRLNTLKRILSRYNHAFLRGARARALLNSVKLGYASDCSLAYIEILHKESELSVNAPACPIGKPRLPIVLLLAGCGTYEHPYYLDPVDLLVRSVPQCPELTTFIDDAWIEVVAELNAKLRTVRVQALEHTLGPVLSFLEHKTYHSGMLGGLQLYLGRFWTCLQPETNVPSKLGIYLTTGGTGQRESFVIPSEEKNTSMDSLSLRMGESKPTQRSIREEELRLRTRTASSTGTAASNIPVTESPSYIPVDTSLPLPGLLFSSFELRELKQEKSSRKYVKWFVYRYGLPFNVPKNRCLPSSWACVLILLVLLLGDLALTFAIVVNLRCIKDGETNAECSASIIGPVLLVYPLAIIASPVFGIIALAISTASFARKYAMWNALSMINIIVCIFVCLVESSRLVAPWFTRPVPILPILSLLSKMAQASIVDWYIAYLETARHRRGWRGLVNSAFESPSSSPTESTAPRSFSSSQHLSFNSASEKLKQETYGTNL